MATTATAGLALRGRGARFLGWARRTFDLMPPHVAVAVEAARLMDRCDAIAARLEADGLTVVGSVGQPRPHPLLAEHRQAALALGRLLDLAGFTEPAVEAPESRTTARARRAAEARWHPPDVPRLDDRRRSSR